MLYLHRKKNKAQYKQIKSMIFENSPTFFKLNLRVRPFGVKIEKMKNIKRKIRWKIAFFTVRLRKKNREDGKPERKFSPRPTFIFLPN